MSGRPVILSIRQRDAFAEVLKDAGFEVVNHEMITTEPLADLNPLQQRLSSIADYDGLIFTSPAAASVFCEAADEKGDKFPGAVYVLGDRCRQMMAAEGYRVTYREEADTAGDLIDLIGEEEFANKRLLFVRGNKTVGTVSERLGRVASLDEVIVYETKEVEVDPEEKIRIQGRLDRNGFDWICFFSPSGVSSFLSAFDLQGATNLRAATIGQTTAGEAESNGLRVEFISSRANAEAFARGLIEYIKNIE